MGFSPAIVGGSLSQQTAEVKRLIDEGHSRTAVELAKQTHKQFSTALSEAVLVDAYRARIRSLQERRMDAEAAALFALVRERYPGSRQKLAGIAPPGAAAEPPLEELVRPLNDPTLPTDQRGEIEAALQRRLTDPSWLARCSALAPEHPLRKGAAALERAFTAVTSVQVREEQILLPEISHRGPLAPWKVLVRAIAAFYRRDQEACERQLQALDPDSPPGRLAPVLRSMLSMRPEPQNKPGAARLMREVGGGRDTLRESVEALEAAIRGGHKRNILEAIRDAVQTCRRNAPDLLERLKQHTAMRLAHLEVDQERLMAALGGPPLMNAYYWLLSARAIEETADAPSVIACSLWEQFRAHAVHEGWFPRKGPEAATLYLHMASILGRESPEELSALREAALDVFKGFGSLYGDQPPSVRAALAEHDQSDRYFLYPDQLYERACVSDPDPSTFTRWLEWAKKNQPGWKGVDRVAEAWHAALPSDPRPLLHLMKSAEHRRALKKALGFLEKAERLDALNPEVGRARLRLLIDRVIDHLRRRKARLAGRELAVLASLRQAQENRRPAFVSALSWLCCLLGGDDGKAAEELARVSLLLNSRASAQLLFACVARACGLERDETRLANDVRLGPDETVASVAATVCAIGEDAGIPLKIPAHWYADVTDELWKDGAKLGPPQLRVLAEAAVRDQAWEAAYAATAAGLSHGGPTEARFLLLRARALPGWEVARWSDCLAAAAELARRQGDTDLVAEIVEERKEDGVGFLFPGMLHTLDRSSFSMSLEKLDAVLKRERADRTYPKFPSPSAFQDPYDDFDEEEPAEPVEILLDAFLDMVQQTARGYRPRRKQRKTAAGPSPDQGSLF